MSEKTNQAAAAPQPTFTHEGKTYKLRLPKVVIPGHGPVTEADICSDEELQAYLLENCADSLLIEVAEPASAE